MRVTKWSPTVEIGADSPIVPIWISFPNLRPHLYSTRILHGLGLLFGRPLKVDHAIAVGLRPSVARVFVEIDVTKTFADKIWLGPEKLGHSDSCCPAVARVVGENVESDAHLGGGIAGSCEGGHLATTVGESEERMANSPNPVPLTSSGLVVETLGVDRELLGQGCDVGSAIMLDPSVCSDLPVAGSLEQCERVKLGI
ncbi:hypothetical protein M5K25_014961 [Dendrobium thyrsiflorum]|uniref:DUF4283 domain-containing protein n=1 Tax=Dendrobium thyrsiflorum TaxID=117978 RepID=A0ABD0UP12_DENTH